MWQHTKIARIIHLQRAIANYLYQLMVPVSQRFTILNHDASVLPVCKVVFGQIGTRNQDIIIEYMRLHVVNSEYLSERRIRKLAFEQTRVWVVVESHSNRSIEIVEFEWLQQLN